MAEMSKFELLKYAVDKGMLDLAYVQKQLEMQKREQYLLKHTFAIWQGKNGKWYTYIPDEEKGRIQRERTSKKDIEDVVIEYWKQFEENPTIKDLFYERLNQKLDTGKISRSTYDRYVCDYNRFFGEFGRERVKEIGELEIDNFLTESMCKYRLTAKGYGNLKTLVSGIFKYAKKKKLVDFSISSTIKDMDISERDFKKNKKNPTSQVFTENELPLILDYLEHNLDMINLGILLTFKTGLRIGELATLKRNEIVNYTIPINRTETRYKDENGNSVYGIKESPKTEAGERNVVLSTDSKWILDKILEANPSGEFLLEKNGKRIKTYSYRRRLRYICEAKLHIEPKSPHKIRKTYCTILIDNGVSDNLIIDQMGHTDIRTSRNHYDFNRKSIEQKRKILDNVVGL